MIQRAVRSNSDSALARDAETVAPRVAFYSHDSFGLGHLRRSLLLSEAVCSRRADAEVLLLTGSPRARFFDRSDSIEVVPLPAITKSADGRYVSRNSDQPLEHTVRRRKDSLREALNRFQPDTLVVDHVPAGLQGELLPLLADLRATGRTRLVAGLRDILDEPSTVRAHWSKYGIDRILTELYDDVLVYGDRDVFDLGELYSLPTELRDRLTYLGYLGRPPLAPLPDRNDSTPHVLCLIGGGGDGFPLARMFLTACQSEAFSATVVTGPFLPAAEKRELQELAAQSNNLHVLGFSSHIDPLIASSEVVVTMGGYNSLMETISLRRKTIVVPRVVPRREQWLRATEFAARGLVSMIEPSELTGPRLRSAIESSLIAEVPSRPIDLGVSFDGVANFVTELSRWGSPQPPSLSGRGRLIERAPALKNQREKTSRVRPRQPR